MADGAPKTVVNVCMHKFACTNVTPKRRNAAQSLTHAPYCAWVKTPPGHVFSGAPSARRAAKRSPIPIYPWVDIFMVIMASGIARGRVRTTATATTTTESRNIAAILQIIAWQIYAALVYRVLLWHWTSMLWSIDTYQNKVSADQYHVTISRAQVYSSSRSSVLLKFTADYICAGFRLDRGLIPG